jgi:hypothetical protein
MTDDGGRGGGGSSSSSSSSSIIVIIIIIPNISVIDVASFGLDDLDSILGRDITFSLRRQCQRKSWVYLASC